MTIRKKTVLKRAKKNITVRKLDRLIADERNGAYEYWMMAKQAPTAEEQDRLMHMGNDEHRHAVYLMRMRERRQKESKRKKAPSKSRSAKGKYKCTICNHLFTTSKKYRDHMLLTHNIWR